MLRLLRQVFVLTVLFALAGASTALAGPFVSMPEATAKSENLRVRFVTYNGSTNGAMVVEVRNTGRSAAIFDADGLFFVPKGDPEKAPQRLGAAGPFIEIAGKKELVHQGGKLTIAAGESKKLRLEVFCIDSHRSSPSPQTKFSIAKSKLPKELRKELKTSNQAIYRSNQGDLKKAKSAVQSNMWKTRDKKWIKLEGERKQEKSSSKRPRHHNRAPLRNRVQQRPRQSNVDRNITP